MAAGIRAVDYTSAGVVIVGWAGETHGNAGLCASHCPNQKARYDGLTVFEGRSRQRNSTYDEFWSWSCPGPDALVLEQPSITDV
jgi:hypothetical protein